MTLRMRLLLIIPGATFLVALLAFEFGLRTGREESPHPLPAAPTNSARQDDATLIKGLLAQDLRARRFAFPAVIEATTGHLVLSAEDPSPGLHIIKAAIEAAAEDLLPLFRGPDSPLQGLRRINEASHYVEDSLRALLDAHPELSCAGPKTAEGKAQRSGYPDLRIEHEPSGTVVYLDPKVFAATNRASTLRTFYYEPKQKSSKINEDAVHYLLGFAHDGQEGAWSFTGWDLVDLSNLEVRLKAEFQASNRDLYPAAAPE